MAAWLARRGQGARVVEVGVEVLEVALVGGVVQALALLHPLVASGDGVQPPVNEQAEPRLAPPPRALCRAAALAVAALAVAELMVFVLAELGHNLPPKSSDLWSQTSDDMNGNDGRIRRQPCGHTMLLIR